MGFPSKVDSESKCSFRVREFFVAKQESLVIHSPDDPPAQLILLFHGVGADADDLVPLGEHLAAEFPQALIVSVIGSEPADIGHGRQWFSIRDISEDNRPARVAAALPAFVTVVRHWQGHCQECAVA